MATPILNSTSHPHTGCSTGQHSRRGATTRPQLVPLHAVAGVRVAQGPQVKSLTQQSSLWQQSRTPARPIARQPARQQQQHQQVDARRAAELVEALPPWAARFRRQVQGLPQGGEAALTALLHAVDAVVAKTEHCGPHRHVLRAYVTLGLIDLVAQAWQQRLAQVQAAAQQQQQQATTEARLALAGCRYLRIEAGKDLARQLHLLLDQEGHSPVLSLGALPAPHALGLPVPQLLRQGLGLDLQNPAIRTLQAPAGALSNLTWDEYEEAAAATASASMCGDWEFCYWHGDATWVPAPFGKFATAELVALLTPAAVLTSLPNGIWGRALVNAAAEFGLSLECQQQRQQQPQQHHAAQQQQQSMPEAVRHLLEESMGLPSSRGVRARAAQFSAAVAQARTAMLGGAAAAAVASSAQAN